MKPDINCKNIDRLIYLTDDELNSQELEVLSEHLKSCSACKTTREGLLAARRMITGSKTGIPDYPDFSESTGVLINTGKTAGSQNFTTISNPNWNRVLSVIRYVSGIAAVFLMILFTWEQALSVRKITLLENRIQTAIIPPEPGLIDRMTIARSILKFPEWNDLVANMNIIKTPVNLQELSRIKILMENRIRSGDGNMSAFISVFQHSGMIRNSITFKNLLK